MSKEKLLKVMKHIEKNNYRWNLYFFKIDRRNTNSYYVFKHTFKILHTCRIMLPR